MRLRSGGARPVQQPDDGALENWLSDLAGGEPSVRRLRERLVAAGEETAGSCLVCAHAAEHDHGSHRADPLSA